MSIASGHRYRRLPRALPGPWALAPEDGGGTMTRPATISYGRGPRPPHDPRQAPQRSPAAHRPRTSDDPSAATWAPARAGRDGRTVRAPAQRDCAGRAAGGRRVSGSPGSVHALRCAADLARRHGAALVPVLAWVPPDGDRLEHKYPDPELRRLWQQDAWQRLRDAIGTAFGGFPRGVRTWPLVLRGEAGPELVSLASQPGNLLVIGAGRRGPLARLVCCPVARHCLAHAHCPVLAVPPPDLAQHVGHGLRGWAFRHRGLDPAKPACPARRPDTPTPNRQPARAQARPPRASPGPGPCAVPARYRTRSCGPPPAPFRVPTTPHGSGANAFRTGRSACADPADRIGPQPRRIGSARLITGSGWLTPEPAGR